MSYYDWEHIVKPLQFGPVTQDTTVNTKPLTVTPVDSVKTGLVSLKVPAQAFTPYISQNIHTIPFAVEPLIVGQFNYSVGNAITILNPNSIDLDADSNTISSLAICIRYRVGGIVHRYLIEKTLNFREVLLINGGTGPYPRSLMPFRSYTNQTILGNFVLEMWQVTLDTPTQPTEIKQDLYLKTGRIYFPKNYGDVGNIIEPEQIVDYTDLSTALPEILPTAQNAAGPWLSN